MDLDYSREDLDFRERVRAWLSENVPDQARPAGVREACHFDLAWQRTLYDNGWAGISWPKEYGGCGLSLVQQIIWHEENARVDAPGVGANFVGLNHGGPTLIACATDAAVPPGKSPTTSNLAHDGWSAAGGTRTLVE